MPTIRMKGYSIPLIGCNISAIRVANGAEEPRVDINIGDARGCFIVRFTEGELRYALGVLNGHQ